MEYIANSSERMDDHSLIVFYTHAILPQFGIQDTEVTWYKTKEWMPGDEVMFKFKVGGRNYALIFEDYSSGDKDAYDALVQDEILASGQTYEFVRPKTRSESDQNPTYDGFYLSGHALYCPYVTGFYTLLRIGDAAE